MIQNQNTLEQHKLPAAYQLAAIGAFVSMAAGIGLSPTETDGRDMHAQAVEQLDLDVNLANPQAHIGSSFYEDVSPTSFLTNLGKNVLLAPPASGLATVESSGTIPMLEKTKIPANVEKIVNDKVAYLPELGCSAFIVEDPGTGEEMGGMFAEHCNMRGIGDENYSTKREYTKNGKVYVVFDRPLAVQTGSTLKNNKMLTVGYFDKIMMPKEKDYNLDLVVGAFKGHSPQEVLDAYDRNKLSEQQLRDTKEGDKFYLAGWPIKQNAKPNELKRQTFELSAIGLGDAVSTNGEDIKIFWAGVNTNDSGAVCSFGNSGGEGFRVSKKEPNKAMSAGTLSLFVSFNKDFNKSESEAINNRHAWERKLGKNLSGFDAMCGFAFETPNAQNSEEIVNVIESLDKIPGHDKNTLINNARKKFLGANSKRAIINGYYGSKSTKDFQWIKNPAVSYDEVTNRLVIGWADPSQPNNLYTEFVDDASFADFHKASAKSPDPSVIISKGLVRLNNTGKVPLLADQHGVSFGAVQPFNVNAEPIYYEQSFYIEPVHNKTGLDSKGNNFTMVPFHPIKTFK